jgi:hypothetical protein
MKGSYFVRFDGNTTGGCIGFILSPFSYRREYGKCLIFGNLYNCIYFRVSGKPMSITYNEIFKQLLKEYHLPGDLSFSIDLPAEVHKILTDKIIMTGLGITLESFGGLYKATQDWENQSIIEDNENHFHVDWLIAPADSKNAFMLGVKTLILLAEKFQKERVNGIRFWYAFQTPELGKLWAKHNNLDEEDKEHLISDRLSFYKLREGENKIAANEDGHKFWAILTIDI